MLEPVFIGFLAKKVVSRPEWLACHTVVEVCSVSECVSKGPPDRISSWTHNEIGLYDSEELALGVVPAGEAEAFELFAYRIYPLRFDEEQPDEAWDPRAHLPSLPKEPDLSGYERLGLDLVGQSMSPWFECSPLSCNGMAKTIAVNGWCLIDELERAIDVGRRFGRIESGVEPAAYFVVEVWRKRRPG